MYLANEVEMQTVEQSLKGLWEVGMLKWANLETWQPITIRVSQQGLEDNFINQGDKKHAGERRTQIKIQIISKRGTQIKIRIISIFHQPGLTVEYTVTEVGFTVSMGTTQFWNTRDQGQHLNIRSKMKRKSLSPVWFFETPWTI